MTGGVGAGKSTVARILAAHGLPIIDTDTIAHELLGDPEGRVVADITVLFGTQVLGPDGGVDRDAMAEEVFEHPARRKQLEGILHPAIGELVEVRIDALPPETDSVVVEVPLLFEAGWDDRMDCVVVVDCPPELQAERFMARTGASLAEARSRIASQLSRGERLRRADFVVRNEGTLEELEGLVGGLARKLLSTGDEDGC